MPKNIDRVYNLTRRLICLLFILTTFACTGPAVAVSEIERVSVSATRTRMMQDGALLVCSYADSRCQKILFKGALLRSDLEARLPSLPMNQEIIFYCS